MNTRRGAYRPVAKKNKRRPALWREQEKSQMREKLQTGVRVHGKKPTLGIQGRGVRLMTRAVGVSKKESARKTKLRGWKFARSPDGMERPQENAGQGSPGSEWIDSNFETVRETL